MEREIKNAVLRFVVYGHVLLALGAALQVWWIGEAWFGEGSASRSAAAFFAAMGFYGIARLMRADDVALKEVPLFIWYRSHAKTMGALAAACAFAALLCLRHELLVALGRLWPVIVAALLYVTPLRLRGSAIGLRDVPGLKSLVVAAVWASGTVLLAMRGTPFNLWALQAAVMLCFYWGIGIAFDCRDRLVDAQRLRTLPQLIGSKAARFIALLMLLPLACMLAISWALISAADGDWSLPLAMAGLIWPAVLIMRSASMRRWSHWLLLDASIALIPLLALVGSLL